MKKMGFGAEPRRLFPLLEPGCHTGPASQRSCAPAQLRSGHTGPGSDGGVATASRSGAFACGSSWAMLGWQNARLYWYLYYVILALERMGCQKSIF